MCSLNSHFSHCWNDYSCFFFFPLKPCSSPKGTYEFILKTPALDFLFSIVIVWLSEEAVKYFNSYLLFTAIRHRRVLIGIHLTAPPQISKNIWTITVIEIVFYVLKWIYCFTLYRCCCCFFIILWLFLTDVVQEGIWR